MYFDSRKAKVLAPGQHLVILLRLDRKLNVLTSAQNHVNQRVDSEFWCFLIDDIGHPKTSKTKNFCSLCLLEIVRIERQSTISVINVCLSARFSSMAMSASASSLWASSGAKPRRPLWA
jgi:hypothetical protein